MNAIGFPIKSGMKGNLVTDLQTALDLLLDDPKYFTGNDAARAQIRKLLQREHVAATFGSATARLVAAFQKFSDLAADGLVDEKTASVLDAYLRKRGQLDPPGPADGGGGGDVPAPGPAGGNGSRQIGGIAVTEAGLPASGVNLRLYGL